MRFVTGMVEDAVVTSVHERRAVARPGLHSRLFSRDCLRLILLILILCDACFSLFG
jgi:hypothetical protein